VGVTVGFEPLPASGKVTAHYSINSSDTWTLLDSISSQNASELVITNESAGNNLSNFKEVQFKLTALQNAKINSLKFKYEELDSSY